MHFIVGTYPEYKNIVEASIAAQYANASVQRIKKPNFFRKKHNDLNPMQTVKPVYYPIRTYKQLEDDPLNNVIDAV